MATSADNATYQVSLQVLLPDGQSERYQHFCGGSIITPRHILTAAHCLEGFPIERISVVAGTLVWDKGGVRRNSSKFDIHELYVRLKSNDIGIITLSEPFDLGKKVT